MMRGPLNQQQATTGLKVAVRIMSAWCATPGQVCKILRISPSTFRRASRGVACGARLDVDQQERIGLVLGIHGQLRATFSNQENVQGFPRLKNFNTFFDGRSPLEIMAQGDMISLYETYKRIERLHSGEVMAGQ